MSRQTEKKLNRLMEKSEELFWKYGYGPVTVDQIADEAGISKMTIYKYFHSKEDLFIEVLKKSIEFHVNRVMEVIAEKNHTIEKIELLYNYSMNIAVGYSDNLLRDIVERKSIFEKVMEMKKKSALHIWRCILEDGIRKKEIRELDLDFVSELFMNLPDILKNMDFPSDKDQMLRFYGNFMDFLKYGFLGGMEEGVYDGEKRTDES